jgi:hypothetical protein
MRPLSGYIAHGLFPQRKVRRRFNMASEFCRRTLSLLFFCNDRTEQVVTRIVAAIFLSHSQCGFSNFHPL